MPRVPPGGSGACLSACHTTIVMILPALLFVFFLSGMAGLIYQVVWVRELGLIFGNTIHSAALVTGVFIVGLGVGGLLAGIVADRAYRRDRVAPLRLYVVSEAGIGLLGMTMAAILPRLGDLSARFSSYRAGLNGWHELGPESYLGRYAIAVLLIAPITLLMGGTLTLLIRALAPPDLSRAGWHAGLLYGFNTAGAASGCLLVDLFWIPHLGIWSTQLFAAGLNLAAALGALLILAPLKRTKGGPSPSSPGPPAPQVEEPSMGLVLAAIVLSGFAAMGMEIFWFRFLTSALGQYRLVFSLLLFEILAGLWLGSTAGGYVSRRSDHARRFWIGSQLAFALSGLGAIYLFDLDPLQEGIRRRLSESADGLGLMAETGAHLSAIFRLVGLPAFFMGFSFPLANALVQRRDETVGRRAGCLYLANCAGAVAGSSTTGFSLIPALGMKGTVLVLMACAVGLTIPIALHRERPGLPRVGRSASFWAFAAGLLVALAGLAAWGRTSDEALILKSFRAAGGKAVKDYLREPYLLARSEGLLETILVVEVPDRGRTLFTNGHRMSSTEIGAQRYMRAMAHVPLLHMDDPEVVLVICFGVGNTAHAASLHASVTSVEVVDISRHVLEQAGYFAETNGRILEDPRVTVFVNDGRQHLRMQPPGRYDLVTLEPPPINFAGVASLYSREFYELAHGRLRPGGFVSQWLPIEQVPPEAVRSMVRALIDVFPNTILLNGDSGHFILIGRKDLGIELGPTALGRRLDANPLVREDLRRHEMGTPTEIFGMFASDAGHLAARVGRSAPLTDDVPLIEYARIYRRRTDIPIDLLDVGRAARWCPDCFGDGDAAATVGDLATYLSIMNRLYARAAAGRGSGAEGRPLPRAASGDPGAIERTVRDSPYLRRMLHGS